MSCPALPAEESTALLIISRPPATQLPAAPSVTFISPYLAKDLKLCFNKRNKQPLKGTLIQRGGGIRPYNTSATGRTAVKVPIPAEKKYLEDKREHIDIE